MELPSYLLDAWRLEYGAEGEARRAKQMKGWTASALAEAFLKYQLEKNVAFHSSGTLSTLSGIAVGKILEVWKKLYFPRDSTWEAN